MDRIVKKNIYVRLLLCLLERDLCREELARALHTRTGNIRGHLYELADEGLLAREQSGKRKMYLLTKTGRAVALMIRAIQQLPCRIESEKAIMIKQSCYKAISDVARLQRDELFDRAVTASLNSDASFSSKFHAAIGSIIPGMAFTLDELYTECRECFPDEDVNKGMIPTCLTRFKNPSYRYHLPNL